MPHRASAGAVDLAYDVSGDEAGPPLVLLHGLGEGRATWSGVRDRLDERHRTVAFDLRGHGASPWPRDYGLDLMADDVVAALDALGLRGVVVVGHSLGGNVGLRVAVRRPDLVARLVVEDVIPPAPRGGAVAGSAPAREVDPRCLLRMLRESNIEDAVAWADLARVAAPTLLVAGGAASHIPQDRLASMVDTVPVAELVTIDAGHHVHRDAPEAFADAVLAWLGR